MTENKKLDYLKDKQDAFRMRIYEVAQNAGLLINGMQPVYDGVCDVEAYKKSYPRIMWILKEAWEKHEDGEKCGDWNLYDPIGKVEETWPKETKSWRFMNLVGYGIINDKDWTYLEKHDRMDGVTMTNVLKDTCCINISKIPGGTSSDDSRIAKYYTIWKDVLFEQIRMYDPEVIIFGGTFKFFKEDLHSNYPLEKIEVAEHEGWRYGTLYKMSGGTYLIDTYHPNARFNNEALGNSIIDLANIAKKRLYNL